jgi:hypothetical protein
MGEKGGKATGRFKTWWRIIATKSTGPAKRFWLAWRVLIGVVAAASLTFGVVAWAIVEYAPSVYGPAAALRDWQTFLAGVVGFAGLIAGALLNSAETRARDQRIRDEDRRALAASLMGDIFHLTSHMAGIAAGIADPKDRVPFRAHPEVRPLLLAEQSGRLGLLKPSVVRDVVSFYAGFHYREAARRIAPPDEAVGPDSRLAMGCASVARNGIFCLFELAKLAKLSQNQALNITGQTFFHVLPDRLLAEIGDSQGILKAVVNRLREVHNKNIPGKPIPLWTD